MDTAVLSEWLFDLGKLPDKELTDDSIRQAGQMLERNLKLLLQALASDGSTSPTTMLHKAWKDIERAFPRGSQQQRKLQARLHSVCANQYLQLQAEAPKAQPKAVADLQADPVRQRRTSFQAATTPLEPHNQSLLATMAGVKRTSSADCGTVDDIDAQWAPAQQAQQTKLVSTMLRAQSAPMDASKAEPSHKKLRTAVDADIDVIFNCPLGALLVDDDRSASGSPQSFSNNAEQGLAPYAVQRNSGSGAGPSAAAAASGTSTASSSFAPHQHPTAAAFRAARFAGAAAQQIASLSIPGNARQQRGAPGFPHTTSSPSSRQQDTGLTAGPVSEGPSSSAAEHVQQLIRRYRSELQQPHSQPQTRPLHASPLSRLASSTPGIVATGTQAATQAPQPQVLPPDNPFGTVFAPSGRRFVKAISDCGPRLPASQAAAHGQPSGQAAAADDEPLPDNVDFLPSLESLQALPGSKSLSSLDSMASLLDILNSKPAPASAGPHSQPNLGSTPAAAPGVSNPAALPPGPLLKLQQQQQQRPRMHNHDHSGAPSEPLTATNSLAMMPSLPPMLSTQQQLLDHVDSGYLLPSLTSLTALTSVRSMDIDPMAGPGAGQCVESAPVPASTTTPEADLLHDLPSLPEDMPDLSSLPSLPSLPAFQPAAPQPTPSSFMHHHMHSTGPSPLSQLPAGMGLAQATNGGQGAMVLPSGAASTSSHSYGMGLPSSTLNHPGLRPMSGPLPQLMPAMGPQAPGPSRLYASDEDVDGLNVPSLDALFSELADVCPISGRRFSGPSSGGRPGGRPYQ